MCLVLVTVKASMWGFPDDEYCRIMPYPILDMDPAYTEIFVMYHCNLCKRLRDTHMFMTMAACFTCRRALTLMSANQWTDSRGNWKFSKAKQCSQKKRKPGSVLKCSCKVSALYRFAAAGTVRAHCRKFRNSRLNTGKTRHVHKRRPQLPSDSRAVSTARKGLR